MKKKLKNCEASVKGSARINGKCWNRGRCVLKGNLLCMIHFKAQIKKDERKRLATSLQKGLAYLTSRILER